MKATTLIVLEAIQNARAAIEREDNPSARRWAHRAATLAPESEEAWLLMAETAAPEAGIVYLLQAQKINPFNPQTQAKISSTQTLLKSLEEANPQKVLSSSHSVRRPWGSVKFRRAVSFVRKTLAGPSLLFCALLVMVFTTWMTWPNDVSRAQANNSYPEISPTGSPAPTLSQSSEAALTTRISPTPWQPENPISLPTATATPVVTPTVTPTIPVPTGPKRIEVDLSEQRMLAYQGDTVVYDFIVSTGSGGSTAVGKFSILDKIPDPYSYPYGFWMPDWLGIYYVGSDLENGIHSLPVLSDGQTLWGDRLGTPASYGCVVLGPQDAKLLYDWVDVGTPVIIRP